MSRTQQLQVHVQQPLQLLYVIGAHCLGNLFGHTDTHNP
jgi:hypothetical protein